MRQRFRCWRANMRRKPKTHLIPVKMNDTVILLHNGLAWQALRLQDVTIDLHEGTTAIFTSLDRHLEHPPW